MLKPNFSPRSRENNVLVLLYDLKNKRKTKKRYKNNLQNWHCPEIQSVEDWCQKSGLSGRLSVKLAYDVSVHTKMDGTAINFH